MMPTTLSGLIEESAQRFGDRPAFMFKPGFRYLTWTYQQVWEATGQVASLLQQKGLKKGDRVLIWGPNCPQWAIIFYGCVRAGVIPVPIDMRSTSDFLELVASKANPSLAFVSRFTPAAQDDLSIPRIYFEDIDKLIHGLPQGEDANLVPDDLVEIMFTSGTTGNPKGVMLTHRNLLANLESIQQVVPISTNYRLLSLLPLSHMFEQMGSLLIAMSYGASVTFPTSRQPAILFKLMQERKVTMLLLVPQALDLFMRGIEAEVAKQGKEKTWRRSLKLARYLPMGLRRLLFKKVHARFGGKLEIVIAGGAALSQSTGDAWHLLGVKVLQGYGATEATLGISFHTLSNPRFDSAGKPLPGVDVRIADDGEILIRGANVTSGYWEAPEQTESAFEDGWYLTGDLGEIDSEGYLHIKGRKKDMIVLSNGQNVFPEDIEDVLSKHPDVEDAAVVGLQNGTEVEVHAALLMENGEVASEAVAWANGQLAEHQQIRGFTVWPEPDFPRTHTLKVKKVIVLETLLNNGESAPDEPAEAHSYAESPNAQEEAGASDLKRLVATLCEMPASRIASEMTVGGDLNLDSLRRVELLSAIEQELGVYIDESLVSSETTFGALESLLESQQEAQAVLPPFYKWPIKLWFVWLREILHRTLMFPILSIMYKARASGMENLNKLEGPALFAANHNGIEWDSLMIIKKTPRKWRRQLSFAAAAEITFGKRWLGGVAALVANAFPLSRETAIRASLEHLGSLMDAGWSVVLFPEGEQHLDQPMLPFQVGTGMLAVESNTAVVPVHLISLNRRGSKWFPLREGVEIRFGEPITFAPGTSYEEATQTIEDAVRNL